MGIKTNREVLNDALREELLRDDKVIIMGCDVGIRGSSFGVTTGLMKDFGKKRIK